MEGVPFKAWNWAAEAMLLGGVWEAMPPTRAREVLATTKAL